LLFSRYLSRRVKVFLVQRDADGLGRLPKATREMANIAETKDKKSASMPKFSTERGKLSRTPGNTSAAPASNVPMDNASSERRMASPGTAKVSRFFFIAYMFG